jgi:hypothetical protein
MAGLDPAIHDSCSIDVDPRDKPGDDEKSIGQACDRLAPSLTDFRKIAK